MATLQLLAGERTAESHGGEVFCCAFTPDNGFVLSAGWDGHLRLWEATSGRQVAAVAVSGKPLSACAISPDGKQWLAGALDGMLSTWDPMTQRQTANFLAHTRPISAIHFAPDGPHLVTSSWDRSVAIWKIGPEREGRTLSGHEDIIAGCCFSPDGRTVVSWSHDRTLRAWDLARGQELHVFNGHADRVTAAAVSPDGRWVASGARDGSLRLWDLQTAQSVHSVTLSGEPRACFFLLDGESLVTIDLHGCLECYSVPRLEQQDQLLTRLKVQSGQLAPSGSLIALGCDDGRVRLVAVQGVEKNPLLVTPVQTNRRTATMLDRIFGRTRVTAAYSCTCPACGQSFDLSRSSPGQPAPCPHCSRELRLSSLTRVAVER